MSQRQKKGPWNFGERKAQVAGLGEEDGEGKVRVCS